MHIIFQLAAFELQQVNCHQILIIEFQVTDIKRENGVVESIVLYKVFTVRFAEEWKHAFRSPSGNFAIIRKPDNKWSADIIHIAVNAFVVRCPYTDTFAQLIRGYLSFQTGIFNQPLHNLTASDFKNVKSGSVGCQAFRSLLIVQRQNGTGGVKTSIIL